MTDPQPYRADVLVKATGEAKYSGDFNMPGMLYAKILWPKYPVAKIIRIDTSKAEAMPGVERVVTRKDITGPNLAAVFEPYDRPVLVGEGEEVRFIGDAIALVAARTEEIAAEALEQIKIEYQPLPGIFTLEQAMKKSNPRYTCEIKRGNVEEAFSRADLIVESEYHFPYVEHAYIEPEAGYAFLDGTGVINVCITTQNLDRHHRMICKSLGLQFAKVRLFAPFVGGAFGGKHSFHVQVYLALLAHLLRKPVKLVWTREESFFASTKRHRIKAKAKLGLDKNGKMLAIEGEVNTPAGSYMGYSAFTLDTVVRYILGPYWIEHISLVGKTYNTNNTEIGVFRGWGATEGTFIIETLIEKAVQKLNLSSEEIRRINWLKEDQVEKHFPGAPWKLLSEKITLEETLGKALNAAGPKPKAKGGKKVGRGIAVAMPSFSYGEYRGGYRSSGADMTMFIDGSINVRMGFPEVGQGITGVITRLTYEVLGIPEEKISVIYSDSHTTPKAGSLGFSQATVVCGKALLSAAQRLKERIEDHAKECLKTRDIDDEVLIENVEFKEGDFYIGDRMCLKFGEFADYCYRMGKNMAVSGWFEGTSPVDKHGITFMSTVVDVEVDEETGEIQVLKIVNCHDIGKVIHEKSAKGQLTGGAVMSMGITLNEEFIIENGKPITTSFSEYLLPTAKDIPQENIALFVEFPGKDCPMGAKGLGEHALYSCGPAISNAVLDATGVSITLLPITPEKLLKALNKI